MNKKTIAKIAVILLMTTISCGASQPSKSGPDAKSAVTLQPQKLEADPVDSILNQLSKKTSELKSYEGQIEYKYVQPLLESEALRKGVLYYARFDDKSLMRINFETLKQEDEEEQKYIEHYIFDGRWLTQINYQIKSAKRYELAEPNKTLDAFDLASRNIPIIGFGKTEDLKKQFEIKLVKREKNDPNDSVRLHLKVKPNSIYKDDYIWLDFWIDKKSGLPARVVALSAEEDVYEIKLLKPKVNKAIDIKVFELKIPKDFGELEIVPLKRTKKE